MTSRALWLALHDQGEVRDPSEEVLGKFVIKMTGVQALQWLRGDQASQVIENLKKWQRRMARATNKTGNA